MRRAWMNFRFSRGTGQFSYKLASGRRFIVFKDDRLSQEIFLGGGYEPTESAMVAAVLEPGDIMFDIGANIGYYSVLGSRHVGHDGRVYAFEPGPRTHARLLATLRELGCANVVAVAEALADDDGTARFSVSLEGRDAQQGFRQNPGLEGHVEVVSVPIRKMDSVVARLSELERHRLKLIKCDVEGGELSVLRGAKAVLAGSSPPFWLLEYNKQALRQAGVAQRDILDNFPGCTFYFVPLAWPPSSQGEPGRRIADIDQPLPDECNLLIVPPSRLGDPCLEKLRRLGILADQCRGDAS